MSDFRPPHPPPLPSGPERAPLIPAWDFLRRNRHVTVPLAAAPLMWAAGNALYAFRLAGTFAFAAVTLCVVFCFFAPHKWRGSDGKPRRPEVWYADLSVTLGSAWLWLAAWLGPLDGTVTAWSLGGTLLAGVIAWGIPWWKHKRPRGKSASKKITGEWDGWWQYHARDWDLTGSSVVDVLTKGVMETLVVQLWRGRQSVRQVESALHLIESALAGYVGHGMLRVQVNPKNPSQAMIKLRRENPLAEIVAWDPSLVPDSVTQPAPIGYTESGSWIMVVLLVNWFVIGRTRGGKSNQLSVKLATLTACPDARVWLIDRKGGRSARPWMPALDWVAVTIDEARKMLRAGVAEIEARAMNAYDGHEQLRPTDEVPALFIVIDETHEVTSLGSRGDTECADLLSAIASMGMGVCVYTVVLTQYGALAESVRSEQVRSNLPNRICFAVTQAAHGAFALSDWDKLNAARLAGQGEFYWQAGPDSPSEPGRGPHMPHELVRQIAARNGAMPRRPLVLYASAHQDVYDTRWSRLPEAFRSMAPQYAAAPLPRHGQEAPSMDTPATGNGHVPPQRADSRARAQRIEDELAGVPDVPLSELAAPDDAALRTEIGRQKQRFARALADAPPEGISPKQLRVATGLSRSWVHAQLSALISARAVIRLGEVGDGAYRAADGADVWQAMEIIREGNAALLAGARSG